VSKEKLGTESNVKSFIFFNQRIILDEIGVVEESGKMGVHGL
jgi:hypothetical protein